MKPRHRQRSSLAQGILLAIAASMALGCLPDGEPTGSSPVVQEQAERSYALVRVRAESPRTLGVDTSMLSVDAHFLRTQALDGPDVLRALDIWTPRLEEQGCRVYETAGYPTERDVRIEMLGAGRVGVSGSGGRVALAPRVIPGYVPQLSGVFYATEDAAGPAFDPGGEYTIWATGEDDVGRFAVVTGAPPAVEITKINRATLGSADRVALAPSDDLSVDFAEPSDDVALLIAPAGRTDGAQLECRFRNARSVWFDRAELDAVFGEEHAIELTVRHAQLRPLPASAGIEGHLLFESTDRVELILAP